MKKQMMIGLLAAIATAFAPGLSANSGQNYAAITSMHAIQSGTCEGFEGGWKHAGTDGNSNIIFCKQTSSSASNSVITDMEGFQTPMICGKHRNDSRWSAFAYDKKANVTYCMKKESSSFEYVVDAKFTEGKECDRKYFREIYNGRSNGSICAKYNR